MSRTVQVRYSQDHQYVIVEDGVGTVGITKYAQEKLSDVTLVELPRIGEHVLKGGAAGVVESVKASSDLYSPVSGEILAVNETLTGKPALVNEDAEGEWCHPTRRAMLLQGDFSSGRGGHRGDSCNSLGRTLFAKERRPVVIKIPEY